MMIATKHTNGAAPADSRQVKAVPGVIYAASGYSNQAAAADVYIQLHDAAAVPANGTAAKLETVGFQALAWMLPIPQGGIFCENGILLVTSSTPQVLTALAPAQNKTTFNAQYA
jgi:hypothetical protein